MQLKRSLVFYFLGNLAIIFSGFLPWVQSPQYSLFKVADYAATFGKYVDYVWILSVGAIALIAFPVLSLTMVFFRRISIILGLISATYCIFFVVSSAIVVSRITSASLVIPNTIGPYLALTGALTLLISVWLEKHLVLRNAK